MENQQPLAGLPEEISSMTEAMDRVQQSLSRYRKFCWVVSDEGKLDDLLRTLTSLNDGLFQVLPTSAKSQVLTLEFSFDIPFGPNIRKSSKFVGREYLLEGLKQDVEGKQAQNTIVLYGTGGMGKTQLALEYIHQHYKDHSSVFWINPASNQTTILGFTQIMQRLILQASWKVSDDYSHIGRLLGMAGKLDSNGSFAATQPSEAQYVVDAVKQWFSLPENTNWLIVFDNLDDPDLVDIEEYIPVCSHGTVVITIRRRDLQQGRRGFKVNQIQPTEAIQLLLTACAIPKFEDLVSHFRSKLIL